MMIVRCIRTLIPNDDPYILNKDLREYLEEGNDYIVYGIRTANEYNYFMIFDDGHLIEVPSEMFEITDGEVSPLWIVREDEASGMTLWPELFYEEYFFENFSEWGKKERKAFEKLRKSFVVP